MIVKFKNRDEVIIECCRCKLQHIWMFKIIRGKTPVDDEVEMQICLSPHEERNIELQIGSGSDNNKNQETLKQDFGKGVK